MGIVTGYICTILCICLMLKYVARKLHLNKLNSIMVKCHKYVAMGFIVVAIIHLVTVIRVFDTRMAAVVVSGIVATVVGITLAVVKFVLKDKKKEFFFHRLFSVVIAVSVIVHIVLYHVDFAQYQEKIRDIELTGKTFEQVEDGVYIGEYDAGYIYAKVRVTMKDHKLEKVELLEHKNERGAQAEVILDAMVCEQTFGVAAVSSATNSSNVIMKACENAVFFRREG